MIVLQTILSPKLVELLFKAVPLLVAGFLAITFLQSGLDKVFDYKGNKAWMGEQFSKTFMRPLFPLLFPVLTICEVTAGALNAAVILLQLFRGISSIPFLIAFSFTGIVLLMLLFGQRISKEYAGAASLTGYFIITLLGILACVFRV